MADPIRFFFDFTSTFSYIAIHQIDQLAARYDRTVDWSCVSLGHLFQAQGVTPPPAIPAKFAYLKIDFARSCAHAGLPCKMPDVFPPDVKLARYMFWRLKAEDEARSHDFARAISAAIFGRGEVVAGATQVAAVCPGVSAADVEAADKDMAAKRAVIASVESAKAAGVSGAPYIIVDGEPFWGADRLDFVERKLARK